jgi:hypothetical protein
LIKAESNFSTVEEQRISILEETIQEEQENYKENQTHEGKSSILESNIKSSVDEEITIVSAR